MPMRNMAEGLGHNPNHHPINRDQIAAEVAELAAQDPPITEVHIDMHTAVVDPMVVDKPKTTRKAKQGR